MKLGKANWLDPERSDCIVLGRELKLNRYFRPPFRRMTCWEARNPAHACLTDAFEKLAILIKNVGHDLYKGVKDDSGIAFHRFMHGSHLGKAQPAIILSSKNSTLRANAARIIKAEEIEVDDRGIDLEFYANAPRRFAGPLSNDARTTVPQNRGPSSGNRPGGPESDESIFINGATVTTPVAACTIGGVITVDGKNFGLTVGHAFEGCANAPNDDSKATQEIHRSGRRVGSLIHKGQMREDLASDWAFCELDATEVTLTNKVVLPNGTRIFPSEIFQGALETTSVWVSTANGCIAGSIKADYSLVALPGSKSFQKTCVVVLERPITDGDCGAWIIDANTSMLYGQIVAGLEGTEIAYIALLKDIFADISLQIGKSVALPTEESLAKTRENYVQPQLDRSTLPEETKSEEKAAWDKSYVLTFDGGGVRGLASLYILRKLMDKVQQLERKLDPEAQSSFHPFQDPKSKDADLQRRSFESGSTFSPEKTHYESDHIVCSQGFYPCHYVDYMAGTSTGGLIAIMLSRMRMDVDDTINEFIKFSRTIFGSPRTFSLRGPFPWPGRPKYDNKIMEKVIRDVLDRRLPKSRNWNSQSSEDCFSSNPNMCKTFIVTYQKDSRDVDDYRFIFRSYDHQTAYDRRRIRNPDKATSYDIASVARCTTAAPTYFKSIELGGRKYWDGGFGCNNPSWEAYNEVNDMQNYSTSGVALIISLGNGTPPRSDFSSNSLATRLFRLFKADGVDGPNNRRPKDNTQRADELLRTWMKSDVNINEEPRYFRFSNHGVGKVELDSWKPSTRKEPATKDHIEKITSEYLQSPEVQQELAKVARILVHTRRLRAKNAARWERYALGTPL